MGLEMKKKSVRELAYCFYTSRDKLFYGLVLPRVPGGRIPGLTPKKVAFIYTIVSNAEIHIDDTPHIYFQSLHLRRAPVGSKKRSQLYF